jgi:hypothetical protein
MNVHVAEARLSPAVAGDGRNARLPGFDSLDYSNRSDHDLQWWHPDVRSSLVFLLLHRNTGHFSCVVTSDATHNKYR